jgi:hypothetical protein
VGSGFKSLVDHTKYGSIPSGCSHIYYLGAFECHKNLFLVAITFLSLILNTQNSALERFQSDHLGARWNGKWACTQEIIQTLRRFGLTCPPKTDPYRQQHKNWDNVRGRSVSNSTSDIVND